MNKVKKKRLKVLIFIAGFISKFFSNIQTIFINISIIILALYFFQISLKF